MGQPEHAPCEGPHAWIPAQEVVHAGQRFVAEWKCMRCPATKQLTRRQFIEAKRQAKRDRNVIARVVNQANHGRLSRQRKEAWAMLLQD